MILGKFKKNVSIFVCPNESIKNCMSNFFGYCIIHKWKNKRTVLILLEIGFDWYVCVGTKMYSFFCAK